MHHPFVQRYPLPTDLILTHGGLGRRSQSRARIRRPPIQNRRHWLLRRQHLPRHHPNLRRRLLALPLPLHHHGRFDLRPLQVRHFVVANGMLAHIVLPSLDLLSNNSNPVSTNSNLTLILCNRAVNRVDPRKYPSGKARIETAGNIAFCFLMTAVSFILIVESIRELVTHDPADRTGDFHLPSVIAVAVAFSTKLALFVYCWSLRNKYSQIRILWEDHRNDLFINGFGLLTSIGGSKLMSATPRPMPGTVG
jgi:hypothetical protein